MPRHDAWGQPIGPALEDWSPPPPPPRAPMHGRTCDVVPLHVESHGAQLFDALGSSTESRRWTYLPYGPFATAEQFNAWLDDCQRSQDPLFFAIIARESGLSEGLASYLRINPPSGSIEVGHLNFSARLSRSAAATEAMYLMMKTAFELGYRRYEWKCDSLNAPSRAAAERLGLSHEGVFRQAVVYKGRSRDTAWYAAIDSEWTRLEAAFAAWLDPSNFDESGAQRTRLSELTAKVLVRRG